MKNMKDLKLYTTLAVYDCDGKIYSAKNTRLSSAIKELNYILQAKGDGNLEIRLEKIR